MAQVLTPKEVTVLIVNKFIAKGEWDGENYHGYLPSGRIASVRVHETDGMLSAVLGVPGGGGLGASFKIFADDATPERVTRYIEHIYLAHQKAKAKWVPYSN